MSSLEGRLIDTKPVNKALLAIYSEAASEDFKIILTLFLLTFNKSVLIKFQNDHISSIV